jgi:uncharacterized protein (DUF4415 family)
MSNAFSSPIFDEQDDYPSITQADFDRAKFRIGLKPASQKERVVLHLDKSLLEYFKAKAGEQDYQALINDTLRAAILNSDLEAMMRRVIREELAGEISPTSTPATAAVPMQV